MAIRAPNHSLQTAAAMRAPGAGTSSREGGSAPNEVPLWPRHASPLFGTQWIPALGKQPVRSLLTTPNVFQ